ncbi:MAG: GIY-YIG nuclease family protein [Cryobacterium sp.]|nr:GIY-YIG nuclease family protein [Cryobacterium sp.]
MPHVYILKCNDGSYYVGSTRNLENRLEQHASGVGASYTRKRLPVTLVFAYELERVDDAYALEKRIQGWSRAKREALIDGRFEDLPALSRKRWVKPSG